MVRVSMEEQRSKEVSLERRDTIVVAALKTEQE
jgi:hypothetical protein